MTDETMAELLANALMNAPSGEKTNTKLRAVIPDSQKRRAR